MCDEPMNDCDGLGEDCECERECDEVVAATRAAREARKLRAKVRELEQQVRDLRRRLPRQVVRVRYPGNTGLHNYYCEDRIQRNEYVEIYSAMTCQIELAKVESITDETKHTPMTAKLAKRHKWDPQVMETSRG